MRALVLVVLVAALVAGLFTPVMDFDAAQYAAIAMDMRARGDWLHILERGRDYLDKPPLIFWTAAASYQLFGVDDWSYKLPSFIAFGVGVYSTRQLALVVYDDDATARAAAWSLASCVAAFLMVSDVRTDTLLLGAVAFATWQWAAWLRDGRWASLLLGALGMGLGMLAKGPIGLVAPGCALFVDVLVHRRWRRLLDARLLVSVTVIGVVLAPMVVGLQQQFGAAGPRFFFWTQSFGRVTGESSWQNDTSPFFFLHTFLWTFAPWSLFAVVGLWQGLQAMRAPAVGRSRDDALALGGFLLVLLAISLSRYKLPHYVYVTFPFAALLAGRALRTSEARDARWLPRAALTIGALVVAVAFVLVWWAFPGPGMVVASLVALAAVVVAMQARQGSAPSERLVVPVAALMAGGFLLVNAVAFPAALAYQAEWQAGRDFERYHVPIPQRAAFRLYRPSLDFAARHLVPDLPDASAVQQQLAQLPPGQPLWLYIQANAVAQVAPLAARLDTVRTYDKFGVSRANGRFLNPATRASVTETWLMLTLWPHA